MSARGTNPTRPHEVSRRGQLSGDWAKSSFSRDASNCVQVRRCGGVVLIRDDKYVGDPQSEPVIEVPVGVWALFLEQVAGKRGTQDSSDLLPAIVHQIDGSVRLTDADGRALLFTAAEWMAFTRGVEAGEFALEAAA
ncbi:DUF397 domain-containing protein [Nocardia sp. NPDC004068]|uniref:DUF397 domain-containing protein n=1 Tax=Nocardia sp. NPDC004068 TaxID=3364303 RepID=UPI00368C1DE9